MAVGDFTPLVLKPELEAAKVRITQAEADVDTLDTQVNNTTNGIVKQLIDIDIEINEAGTGIKARLDDLEQGGTSTTKFRTHSPSGVYEDGEVVQRNGSLYKANSAIDGSVTAVPFTIGTTGATWSAVSKHNPEEMVNLFNNTAKTGLIVNSGGITSYKTDNTNETFSLAVDHTRKRVSVSRTGSTPAAIADTDLLLKGDADELYVASPLSEDLVPSVTDAVNIGSESLYYKGGYYQFVNFMSAANVSEGNVDADSGSLGVFGTTELALGHGNNTKDMTFSSAGITVNDNMTFLNGNSIRFQDADSTQKEGVNIRMNGNDLAFYGVNQGVEGTTPIATLTYQGVFTAANVPATPSGSPASFGTLATSTTKTKVVSSPDNAISVSATTTALWIEAINTTNVVGHWSNSSGSRGTIDVSSTTIYSTSGYAAYTYSLQRSGKIYHIHVNLWSNRTSATIMQFN